MYAQQKCFNIMTRNIQRSYIIIDTDYGISEYVGIHVVMTFAND